MSDETKPTKIKLTPGRLAMAPDTMSRPLQWWRSGRPTMEVSLDGGEVASGLPSPGFIRVDARDVLALPALRDQHRRAVELLRQWTRLMDGTDEPGPNDVRPMTDALLAEIDRKDGP